MDLSPVAKSILEDPVLSKLATLARKRRVRLFVVGGMIRDLFLGTHRYDYDLALPPEASSFIPEIEEALGFHFFMIGKEEISTATYRVIKPGLSVDLALLQGETIDKDLLRRDFTVNAIAFSLSEETFHWVEGALDDIAKRIIRTVTDHSIDQDPLRMLRAIRYLSSLDGFELDGKVSAELFLKKRLIEKVPAERIKMELDKILLSRRRTLGMDVLHKSGLLLTLFPELEGLESLEQGSYHHLDALSHTLLALEKMAWALDWIGSRKPHISPSEEDRLSLCYAILFHDLGKQSTLSRGEDGSVHFYRHEVDSCRAAEKPMERLRFPGLTKEKVLCLVGNHMTILTLSPQTKESALKKLVNRMGELTPLLVALTLADKEAGRGSLSVSRDDRIEALCLRILDLYGQKEVVHPPSLVTGHDVMALGIEPGPRVGHLLERVREKQVVGEVRTREEALKVLLEEVRLP
jgi:tRNA nucleotidyltransferase/poly(A) polymerase